MIDGDTADTQTIIEDEETNYLSLYTISVRLSLISVSVILRHKAFYYIWFQTKTFLQVWSYINYIDFVVTSFVYFHVNKRKGVWTSEYGNSNVQKTQKFNKQKNLKDTKRRSLRSYSIILHRNAIFTSFPSQYYNVHSAVSSPDICTVLFSCALFKADMKSYKQLETAVIFYLLNHYLK